MTLLLPPRWPTVAPLTRARSSLWDKCIAAIPFWQSQPRNVVAGAFATTFGSPALVATSRGYALDFNGTDQALSFPAAFASRTVSISFMFRRTVAAADTRVLLELTGNFNTTSHTFSVFLEPGDKISVNIHSTGGLYKVVNFTPTDPADVTFLTATIDYQPGTASVIRLWQDGVELAGTIVLDGTLTTVAPFAAAPVYVSARGGNTVEAQSQFSALMLHDRLLSDAEIRLLHADPFQMFAPDLSGLLGALAGDAAGGAGGAGASGSVTAPAAIASGSASRSAAGSGAAISPAATASGSAGRVATAAGAASPAPATAQGNASRSAAGSGATVSAPATASGVGARIATAFGAASAPAIVASGSASRAASGSGAIIIPFPTTQGAGTRSASANGGVIAPAAVAFGGTQAEVVPNAVFTVVRRRMDVFTIRRSQA